MSFWARAAAFGPNEARSLRFPNASRSYDDRRQCVSFWAHDAALEIVIHIDNDALRLIGPSVAEGEDDLLDVFDSRRPRIEAAAAKAYLKNRLTFHRLTVEDF